MAIDANEKEMPKGIGVEWGMRLQLRLRNFTESYWSTLVGMDRGQYLICTTPRIPGIWVAVNGHEEAVIRYLYRGVVYGFKSRLLNLIDEPFRLLFLSYPENIETVNLRQHQRIPCLVPATAKKDDAVYNGVLLDLSLTGCCFAFDTASDDEEPGIGPGQEIGVSFQVAGLTGSPMINVEVVNVRKRGRKVTIGGSFKDLKDDTLAAVRTHIEMIQEFVDMEEM